MNKTLSDILATLQALSTNIEKVFPSTFTFLLEGQTLSVAQAKSQVDEVLTAYTATAVAKGAFHSAHLAQVATVSQKRAFIHELEQAAYLAYGNDPATLQKLGLKPRKARAPLSAAAKVAAEAKAAATRKARGTKSKKAAAAIKGTVTGVQIIPVDATGTAAATSTPGGASSAPSGGATPVAAATAVAAAAGAGGGTTSPIPTPGHG